MVLIVVSRSSSSSRCSSGKYNIVVVVETDYKRSTKPARNRVPIASVCVWVNVCVWMCERVVSEWVCKRELFNEWIWVQYAYGHWARAHDITRRTARPTYRNRKIHYNFISMYLSLFDSIWFLILNFSSQLTSPYV